MCVCVVCVCVNIIYIHIHIYIHLIGNAEGQEKSAAGHDASDAKEERRSRDSYSLEAAP